MRRWTYLAIACLFGTQTLSEEPVIPPVVFPVTPVDQDPQPDPVPPPKPVPVTTLAADEWYVIQSDIPCLVLDSRQGIVRIGNECGPLKLRGKFVDSAGKIETRTYDSKHIYTVEAEKKGEVELLVVPVGASDISSVYRRTLTVMGQGPQPPPDPDVDPEPDPEPQPVPPKGIRVLLLYDEDASRDQLNTINSTDIVKWMTENCVKGSDGRPEWRRWDRTSIDKEGMLDKEDPVWKKLWTDVRSKVTEDNMVIVATDDKVQIHPMGTPEQTLALLARIKEGR